MAQSPSGFNTIGLPLIADGLVGSGFLLVADTEAPNGSSPQAVAVSLNQISAGALGVVAAAGATQLGATALPTTAQNVRVTVTASTEGVILPTAATGKVRRIFVPGTVGVKVYPPVGGQIDATATNGAVALAAGKGNIYVAIDTTHWKIMVKGA